MSEEEAQEKAGAIIMAQIPPGDPSALVLSLAGLQLAIAAALIEASKVRLVHREAAPFVFDDDS